MSRYLLACCFSVSWLFFHAQSPGTIQLDSTETAEVNAAPTPADSIKSNFFSKVLKPGYPNPERAAALSLVFPGAGQLYNKRFAYIKVPIIYAGYTGLIISGEFNRKRRNDFQTALELAVQGMPHEFTDTRLDSPNALRTTRDQFDKRYQLSYIGIVILHLVQTLEAYTTAHLLEFDTDESLTICPTLVGQDALGFGESRPGLKLVYHLGR